MRRLWQVLLVYVGVSYAVLEAVGLFIEQLGLPDWVFRASLLLLLVGLPIVALTTLVQAGGPIRNGHDPTLPLGDEGDAQASSYARLRGLLTWRNALLGGVLAFVLLGIGTGGYMAMRVLGIGPAGTLVAKGVLSEGERIVIAEFEDNASDSTLAQTVTSAFRIDLSGSPTVNVMSEGAVANVFERMTRPSGTRLDPRLAREVALREGIKAVVTGEVGIAGTTYIISAQLLSSKTEEIMWAGRETAVDAGAIIPAVDRLSETLRERIGESLASIRASPDLRRVTTPSLEALRAYSEARRAYVFEQDYALAVALLEQALAYDSAFAAAWFVLSVALGNTGEQKARQAEAIRRAYLHRDRATATVRDFILQNYYRQTGETEKAIAAFRSSLQRNPESWGALNNLGLVYNRLRHFAQAEDLFRQTNALMDSSSVLPFKNLVLSLTAQGRFDEAAATLEVMEERFPGNPEVTEFAARLAMAQGEWATGQRLMTTLREDLRANLRWRGVASLRLASIAAVQGHMAEAERDIRDAIAASEGRGLPGESLRNATWLAYLNVRVPGTPDRSLQLVEEALLRHPLESLDPLDRPSLDLAVLYANCGRPDLAKVAIAEFETIDPELRGRYEPERHQALGVVALAEERAQVAISELRAYDDGTGCVICALPDLGWAYELAAEPDSAIAVYERYVTAPFLNRLFSDPLYLVSTYERLGALYEERGDADTAINYYAKLAELWKDADPELQPRVEAARRAIAALSPDQ